MRGKKKEKKEKVAVQGDRSFSTGFLRFDNNYALAENIKTMPEKDITIEMWAKTAEYKGYGEDRGQLHHTLLTYSAHAGVDSGAGVDSDGSEGEGPLLLFEGQVPVVSCD